MKRYLELKDITAYRNRAQVLIFVFFLLLIVGILAGALAVMWQSQIQTLSSGRDGLIAFYLAQTGVERGKIEILNNVNLAGWQPPNPPPNDWYTDLDIPGDNYTFRYNFNVVISGTQRTLIGRGEVLDVNNNLLAHREITVTVNGIQDTDADGRDNDPPNNSVLAWSWREL